MNNKNTRGRRELIPHDANKLKNFWEKKIEKQTSELQSEDVRRGKSALSKLREEWNQRLESRVKMLQRFQEDQRRQMYAAQKESFELKANTAA